MEWCGDSLPILISYTDHLWDACRHRGHEPAAVAVDDGHAEEELGAGRRLVVGAEEAKGERGPLAGRVEPQQRCRSGGRDWSGV